jgi:hypothetical protein
MAAIIVAGPSPQSNEDKSARTNVDAVRQRAVLAESRDVLGSPAPIVRGSSAEVWDTWSFRACVGQTPTRKTAPNASWWHPGNEGDASDFFDVLDSRRRWRPS